MTHPDSIPASDEALVAYDAGLLNDHGGGNVEWWQDYIRAQLGRAHDFYAVQFHAREAAAKADAERLAEDATIIIRSLMREIGVSDHLARRPEPVDGKTQWVSAEDVLARLATYREKI